MKKIKYVFGLSLLAPVIAFAPVLAETGSSTSTSNTTTTSTETRTVSTTDSSDETAPETKDPALMKKRLDGLKANFKTKLDDNAKKRITLKCKLSQTVVVTAETSDKGNGTKRLNAYKGITENLQKLIDRLKANGKDATALEATQTALLAKIATFKTDFTAYRQTLSDLHTLDCGADPTAFQAALVQVRSQREALRVEAAALRTYINGTVKTALVALKATLEDNTKTTTQTTGGKQ